MKAVKITGFGIISIVLIIIIWMNLTPGYFQSKHDACRYDVVYIQDKDNPPVNESQFMVLCYKIYPSLISIEGITAKIKLLLSTIDFNR